MTIRLRLSFCLAPRLGPVRRLRSRSRSRFRARKTVRRLVRRDVPAPYFAPVAAAPVPAVHVRGGVEPRQPLVDEGLYGLLEGASRQDPRPRQKEDALKRRGQSPPCCA